VILDAGTGIRLLGKKIVEAGEAKSARVFLTHYHWDHIQGLPFFPPIYQSEFDIRIAGPEQAGEGVDSLLAGLMTPPYFPVTLDQLPASFTFVGVEEGSRDEGQIRIRAMRMRHPSFTLGYRVEAFGRSAVYIPDNELEGGHYETPAGWRRDFHEFVRGADVLLHDAMFTESERAGFEGWGHSAYEDVVKLALQTEVRSLWFFHHAPGRSDADLDAMVERFRDEPSVAESALEIHAAAEGQLIQF
jgi:ribonuclease BN (tRNA processing enzyme)